MPEITLEISDEILELLNKLNSADNDPANLVEIADITPSEIEEFLKYSKLTDDEAGQILLAASRERSNKIYKVKQSEGSFRNTTKYSFSPAHLFTSESVTDGHPDKIADQISDAILDAILEQDSTARVDCKTLVTTGLVIITGEVQTSANVNYKQIVHDTISKIGYKETLYTYDLNTLSVIDAISTQPPGIAHIVDFGGADDQGLMFGFACNETPELMPLPIQLAHNLTRKLSEVRRNGELPYLRPDGKSQVTVEYRGKIPFRVEAVVVSTQHDFEIWHEQLRKDILEKVIKASIPADLLDENTKYHINPTGLFVIGGPTADTGLTGHKIIVDTYGGYAPHGGGAFSGKDPMKIERSATYMARYIAKNIVAADLAEKCTIQLAYVIGVAEPVSIRVDTHNTSKIDESKLLEAVRNNFKLTPKGIIHTLDLRRPIYRETARFGPFGNKNENFLWEKTDKAHDLYLDLSAILKEQSA